MRKEVGHAVPRRHCLQIGEDHLDVAGELPQNLPARSAGWRWRARVGHDGDAPEGAVSVGERLEDRDALGAHGETIGGILDIATGDDVTVHGFEGRTDLEPGIVGHRPFTGRARGLDERVRGGQ